MNDHQTSADAVVIERTFDAPVTTVWDMWTRPEHFRAWYGPMGATVPIAEMDVRVGGSRRIAMEMQTPNGPMTMWFVGEYTEVRPTARLVYTESIADEAGRVLSPTEAGLPADHPEVTEVVVEFVDLGDRTSIVMTHRGVPADSGGATGWTMAFDKLVTHLARLG
jgi:uncharacterized protein YndB with AHSA1/START domain